LEELFLRLDPDEEALAAQPDLALEVHVLASTVSQKLCLALASPGPDTFTLYSALPDRPFSETGRFGTICRRKVIELAVPLKELHLQAGQEFRMSLVVMHNGFEIERYPRHHPLALTVPDQDFEAMMWKV
jgi:hypothetical protein